MRIDWVIPCRYAEPVPDGTATIIGAGIDTFYVPAVPTDVSLMIVSRIVGTADEMIQEHVLAFELLDDDLGTLGQHEMRYTPGLNPAREPGWEAGNVTGAVHQFRVEREGTYTLNVRLDGGSESRLMRAVSLRVALRH